MHLSPGYLVFGHVFRRSIRTVASPIIILTTVLVLAVIISPFTVTGASEEQTFVIDVKPGAGRQELKNHLGSFTCIFAYKAQGGTNEQWRMVLSADGSKRICTVERPSGQSYLFFEQFKLEVSGAKLKETVLERQQGVALRNEEYIVVSDENYVQQWDNKFNSQLTKVQIIATRSPSDGDL